MFLQSLAEVAAYLHFEQGYLTPLCLLSTRFFGAFAVIAACSHWEHGYLTPWCLYSI